MIGRCLVCGAEHPEDDIDLDRPRHVGTGIILNAPLREADRRYFTDGAVAVACLEHSPEEASAAGELMRPFLLTERPT